MEELSTFLDRWPKVGAMRNWASFQRPNAERRIPASDFSYRPTATAHDDSKSPEAHPAVKKRMPGGEGKTITSLNGPAQMWPTPRTRDTNGPGKHGDREWT